MISESQQEQAALYALGLLDADEAAAFERELDADADLRALERDLRESAALLAFPADGSVAQAPAALRAKVLSAAWERPAGVGRTRGARLVWLPWAIAALFMACSAVLRWAYLDQQDRTAKTVARSADYADTMVDPAQLSFCALEPTPEFNAQPRAAVLWDAKHERGQLRVNRLAPPAEGKDYQLWTVEAGRKESISAGVVHVGADGTASVSFRPVEQDAKPVVAVAISLEQAGGSPTNKGPILLLGKF